MKKIIKRLQSRLGKSLNLNRVKENKGSQSKEMIIKSK